MMTERQRKARLFNWVLFLLRSMLGQVTQIENYLRRSLNGDILHTFLESTAVIHAHLAELEQEMVKVVEQSKEATRESKK